jgi:hypothetical protein
MRRRTAINAPTGNVPLAAKAALAVAPGWVVNPRQVSAQPHRLQGGEMILMPASQPQALKALKRIEIILNMIRA